MKGNLNYKSCSLYGNDESTNQEGAVSCHKQKQSAENVLRKAGDGTKLASFTECTTNRMLNELAT